jgi:hypothetical protein
MIQRSDLTEESEGDRMQGNFTIDRKDGKHALSANLKGAVICGYTGRDQSAIHKHIEELAKQGIKPPPSVPMFYPKPAWGLSLDEGIQVQGAQTSGEVEFVLLVQRDKVYVGVGSDHTDRELEKLDIPKSKQTCPSVFSKVLWDYDEIKDHWDQIEFRSWVTLGGEKTLYQQSTLASLLKPEDIIARVRAKVLNGLEGIVLFCGTPALLTDGFVFADRFECELSDLVLKRKIIVKYEVQTLTWFTV